MPREIKITLFAEVPDDASDQDITDWVDVEFQGCNSMKTDNPCIGSEVFDNKWEWD